MLSSRAIFANRWLFALSALLAISVQSHREGMDKQQDLQDAPAGHGLLSVAVAGGGRLQRLQKDLPQNGPVAVQAKAKKDVTAAKDLVSQAQALLKAEEEIESLEEVVADAEEALVPAQQEFGAAKAATKAAEIKSTSANATAADATAAYLAALFEKKGSDELMTTAQKKNNELQKRARMANSTVQQRQEDEETAKFAARSAAEVAANLQKELKRALAKVQNSTLSLMKGARDVESKGEELLKYIELMTPAGTGDESADAEAVESEASEVVSTQTEGEEEESAVEAEETAQTDTAVDSKRSVSELGDIAKEQVAASEERAKEREAIVAAFASLKSATNQHFQDQLG